MVHLEIRSPPIIPSCVPPKTFKPFPVALDAMEKSSPDDGMLPETESMPSLPVTTSAWQRVVTNTIIGGAYESDLRCCPAGVKGCSMHGFSPADGGVPCAELESQSRPGYMKETCDAVCLTYARTECMRFLCDSKAACYWPPGDEQAHVYIVLHPGRQVSVLSPLARSVLVRRIYHTPEIIWRKRNQASSEHELLIIIHSSRSVYICWTLMSCTLAAEHACISSLFQHRVRHTGSSAFFQATLARWVSKCVRCGLRAGGGPPLLSKASEHGLDWKVQFWGVLERSALN